MKPFSVCLPQDFRQREERFDGLASFRIKGGLDFKHILSEGQIKPLDFWELST